MQEITLYAHEMYGNTSTAWVVVREDDPAYGQAVEKWQPTPREVQYPGCYCEGRTRYTFEEPALEEAMFDRFSLLMTVEQAESASHPGPCDAEVAALVNDWGIAEQLRRIGTDAIRDELHDYGAWSYEELKDNEQNRHRIVWIAAGNISEEITT